MDQKKKKKNTTKNKKTNRAAAAQRVFQPMINNRPPTNSSRREPPASNCGNGLPLLAIYPTVPSKPVILLMPDMRKICAINNRPSSGPIRCNVFMRAVPYREGALRRKGAESSTLWMRGRRAQRPMQLRAAGFFPPLTKHRTHGQSCETTAPLLVNTAQRGATADIYSDGARRNIIKMVSRETSMLFASPLTPLSPLRQAIADAYTADETDCVEALLRGLARDTDARVRIASRARELVIAVRGHQRRQGTLEAFLQEYDLSSQEGVVLMCLAEALLRIPDAATVDRLIRDRLGKGDWDEHLGHSHSLWVNASTWGLMLTGRVVRLAPDLL